MGWEEKGNGRYGESGKDKGKMEMGNESTRKRRILSGERAMGNCKGTWRRVMGNEKLKAAQRQ